MHRRSQAKRPLGAAAIVFLAVVLVACTARQADVQTNTISAAQPTAFHTQSDTAITSVGLAARDAGCSSTLGGRPVSACKWFFKARLSGAGGVDAVVPAGADSNPVRAYPEGSGTGSPPTQTFPVVEADRITLQPQVKYQTQACAYVNFDDNPAGLEGPFCAGADGDGNGRADLGSWGPAWITQPDPSGHAVERFNGLILHWADTSTERHVDIANCVSSTLLANNPGLSAGFNEITQFNVTDRMLVRVRACPGGVPPPTTEVLAFNQNAGANNIYGQASYSFFLANGHIVFNSRPTPNPTFFVNDFYVNQFADNFDETVVKHEIGHTLGLAHDDRNDPTTGGPKLMRPVNFGTPAEVSPSERAALSFLYGHTDAVDGNSGDSTPPPAGGSAAPAFHPDAKELKQKGKGGKVIKRYGAREVLELLNAGDGVITATITVYATEAAATRAAAG